MQLRSTVAALAALVVSMGAVRAAASQITVVGSVVEEHRATAGETRSGTVRLRNAGAAPARARVYLTDYAFTADGLTAYGPAGGSPRSSARWVTFSPSSVEIPALGEATVTYTVSVPAALATRGTFWSMLMVEGEGVAAAGAAARGARVQVGVGAAVRHGVQIATTVGQGSRLAGFQAPRVAGVGARRRLEVDVTNAGELAYRPMVRLELFDAAGTQVRTLQSQRGLLYPGTSLRQTFEIGALPPGTYQALVTADTGDDDVFAGQYVVRL